MNAALALRPRPVDFVDLDCAPTNDGIDRLAHTYLALESRVAELYRIATAEEEPLLEFSDKLTLLIEKFGGPHAKKSKILCGAASELVCTFGSTATTDTQAVEILRDALKAAGRTRILSKLFVESVRYTLAPEANAIVRGESLSDHLKALFLRCQVTKPTSPRLSVRLI